MTVSSDSLPPDRAGSPSSLIVTFAGCYLRQIGGWIAVADLIRLLALVDVPEPAVRQAVVRLKSRGFLAAERRGSIAGYALTDAGRADLEPGDRRIFRYGQADAADGWVLAVFSVPESHRQHRHRLRTQLGWLGFGTVGSGVWAAPAGLAEPARMLLRGAGLDGYITWFRAHALDPVDVSAWWDLEGLRAQYEAFLRRWQHPCASITTGRVVTDAAVTAATVTDTAATVRTDEAVTDEAVTDGAVTDEAVTDTPVTDEAVTDTAVTDTAVTDTAATDTAVTDTAVTEPSGSDAFARYLRLVDDWRLFPRIDPGLPAELLPADWPGPVAWEAFRSLRARWSERGLAFLRQLI